MEQPVSLKDEGYFRSRLVGLLENKLYRGKAAKVFRTRESGVRINPVDLSITAKSVAKIALMVVPFYQSSKDKKALSAFNKDEIQEVFSTFTNGLKPVPKWSCAWPLHHKFQEKPMEFENRFELYPCVGNVAMVKPV